MTGKEIVAMRQALATQRTPFEGHWDDLSLYFMPFRLSSLDTSTPDIYSAQALADSEGRRSALILANGLASLIVPREEIWFEFMPPTHLRDDQDTVAWYRTISGIAREFLESSNFYEEMQEALIESPVYGTAALFLGDLGHAGELHFRHCPIKTYYIGEDARGRVNRFVRVLRLTPVQAAEEFGIAHLPRPVTSLLGKAEENTTTHEYIHAVLPRTRIEPDAAPSQEKPFASYVVHADTCTIVQDAGFEEFPFAVHRYRRFGRVVWGFGPGTTALGDARQLQELNDLADLAAEKAVNPPIIAPSSLDGEIGIGAAEITFVDSTNDPNAAAILREWATVSRYDFAKDRLSDKRLAIQQAFHVDLFQLFSARAMERAPMTATEASLISGEKPPPFSPVFGRLVSEMLDPILTRLFGVLLRAGMFPPAPAPAISPDGNAVQAPALLYKNRILLAMQERANMALANFIGLIGPVAQVDPDALIALDTAVITREAARNAGLPENWIRKPKAIAAIQQQRADAAQAQQAAAMAEQSTKAAANLSQAPPNIRAAAESAILP
jgi:hypothetical protein